MQFQNFIALGRFHLQYVRRSRRTRSIGKPRCYWIRPFLWLVSSDSADCKRWWFGDCLWALQSNQKHFSKGRFISVALYWRLISILIRKEIIFQVGFNSCLLTIPPEEQSKKYTTITTHKGFFNTADASYFPKDNGKHITRSTSRMCVPGRHTSDRNKWRGTPGQLERGLWPPWACRISPKTSKMRDLITMRLVFWPYNYRQRSQTERTEDQGLKICSNYWCFTIEILPRIDELLWQVFA